MWCVLQSWQHRACTHLKACTFIIASTSPGGRWGCGGPPTPVREHIGSITGQSSRLRGQGRVETVILVITMHMSVEWMSLALAPHRSRMDPTLGTFVHKSDTTKVLKSCFDYFTLLKSPNFWLPGDYFAAVHSRLSLRGSTWSALQSVFCKEIPSYWLLRGNMMHAT